MINWIQFFVSRFNSSKNILKGIPNWCEKNFGYDIAVLHCIFLLQPISYHRSFLYPLKTSGGMKWVKHIECYFHSSYTRKDEIFRKHNLGYKFAKPVTLNHAVWSHVLFLDLFKNLNLMKYCGNVWGWD